MFRHLTSVDELEFCEIREFLDFLFKLYCLVKHVYHD